MPKKKSYEQKQRPQYGEYVVAYLDVLGFRKMVLKNEREKVEAYFDISGFLRSITEIGRGSHGIDFISFSDSIAAVVPTAGLSQAKKRDTLRAFFVSIGSLQSALAAKNVWLRGGISIGDLTFSAERQMIFGPALIEAYDHAEKFAKYPRVVVDQKFIATLGFESTKQLVAYFNTFDPKDPADFKHTVLFEWRSGESTHNSFHRDYPLFIDYMSDLVGRNAGENIQLIVQNLHQSSRESPEAYEKLRWVGDYLMVRHRQALLVGPTNYEIQEDWLAREIERF